MLVKSPAIVLGSTKYGDNSIILRTYTRENGFVTFIGGRIRNKSGVLRSSFILPLTQLNTVFYDRNKGDLKRLKEVNIALQYQSLSYEPLKSSVAMFLSEILGHVLHGEGDIQLYDFVSASMKDLDELEAGVANFHLYFLFQLTTYLGFRPEEVTEGSDYFDLLNGVYVDFEPPHQHYLKPEFTLYWKQLQELDWEELAEFRPGRTIREKLLTALLEYYRLHVQDFGKLKSLEILKALLS